MLKHILKNNWIRGTLAPEYRNRAFSYVHRSSFHSGQASLSREEQQTSARSGIPGAGRTGTTTITRAFVGMLPSTLTDDDLKKIFQKYGEVTDWVEYYDLEAKDTMRYVEVTIPEKSVDKALRKISHRLKGKLCLVGAPEEHYLPRRDPNFHTPGFICGPPGSIGAALLSLGKNENENQTSAGLGSAGNGHSGLTAPPPIEATGYGNQGYEYGDSNGSQRADGVHVNTSPKHSFRGTYPGGGYGNPNALTSGYTSGPPGGIGAARISLGKNENQTSAGLGSAGYGRSGLTAPPRGRPPIEATGYGYGYGGSNGSQRSDGVHVNTSPKHSFRGTYPGGGYGNPNTPTPGYICGPPGGIGAARISLGKNENQTSVGLGSAGNGRSGLTAPPRGRPPIEATGYGILKKLVK